MSERLKLRARDADDLQVLSACLQDAILPISDLAWEREARRFVMVANRFCWERVDDRHDAFDRVNCGVTFETVNAVKLRRIDRRDRSLMLSLLTIDLEPLPTGIALTLLCADNRDIRLEADTLAVQLEDFDGPWPTRNRPSHLLGEPS
ncbi:MAG TPA: DUF2948 family protein [Candidatus Sulfotelmatobacter sp.]|nr:DUF2948 family protein [Candidatus Sulfotelmatobacter sp.]